MEHKKTKIILYAKNIVELNKSEKLNTAMKLHCWFADASKEKLLKLVKGCARYIFASLVFTSKR